MIERFLLGSRHMERNRVCKKISRNHPVVCFFLSHRFTATGFFFARYLFLRSVVNPITHDFAYSRAGNRAIERANRSCFTKRRARAIKCIMNTICAQNKSDPRTIANGTELSM